MIICFIFNCFLPRMTKVYLIKIFRILYLKPKTGKNK